MTGNEAYNRFYEVLEFAARKHAGQKRKGSGVPYIVHPVAVAEILARYGVTEDLVYAGLLHDVLEDAGVSKDELAQRFGDGVAHLVAAVSEQKKDDCGADRPWDVRKAEQLAHLRTAESDVVLLKAADVLHNITSICHDLRLNPIDFWRPFHAGKEAQVRNYSRIVAALGDRLGDHPLKRELQAAIDNFIAACK